MHLPHLRERVATALGLAAIACDPAAPPLVTAPVTTITTLRDAAAPKPPGKQVDLPAARTCPGHEYASTRCESPLTDVGDERYPGPYSFCRVNPNFSAQATDTARAKASETCCYVQCTPMGFEGRPFRAQDMSVHAATPVLRSDWKHAALCLTPCPERSARWLRAALAEHASVAAFSQISLQLLALGAPARLLEGTHRAALDEIRHAEITFALASAYGGGTHVGPSPLSIDTAPASRSLREVAIDALLDGCIGEAANALAMADEAEHEPIAEVAALIRTLVSDEERHAILAWQVVQWAIAEDAALLPVLTAALEREALGPSRRAQVAREVAMPILQRLSVSNVQPVTVINS